MDKKHKNIGNLIDLADGFDRSWTFGAHLQDERFLLFFDGLDSIETVASSAVELGFPEQAIVQWKAHLKGADAIGLSANKSLTAVRLYAQYWEVQIARIQQGNMAAFPLYRGWKKTVEGELRKDEYICTPMASGGVYLPLIEDLSKSLGFSAEVLEDIKSGLPSHAVIFAEISNPKRKSWLATVRKAGLPPALIKTWVTTAQNKDGIGDLIDHAGHHPILHLAGGEDLEKGKFHSIYFEAEAEDIKRLIGLN